MKPLTRVATLMISALLAAASVNAQAGGARQTLDDYIGKFRTLQADFEQTVINEQGKTTETSSGKVFLERPGKFHWDYVKPYAQSIVGDGKKVWVYDRDLEQVTIRRVDEALRSAPALILSSDSKVDDNFTVTEDGSRDGAVWLTLLPKDAKDEYSKVRVGFEGRNLRWMELFDNFGQTTRLKFTSEKLNAALDSTVFAFTPPPGVDVNDLSANGPEP
jgi:outer membrane lipoprotein carrier protein